MGIKEWGNPRRTTFNEGVKYIDNATYNVDQYVFLFSSEIASVAGRDNILAGSIVRLYI